LNRLQGKIFGPLVDEITGMLITFCNCDIHNLYCSPNIRMIKSRRILWMGNVACKGYVRNSYSFLVRKPKGETGCSM
jgi:hypothetical protein